MAPAKMALRNQLCLAGMDIATSNYPGRSSRRITCYMATTFRATTMPKLPKSLPLVRVIAMPADANSNGDIFGGWLLSQMDLAGSVLASKATMARTVTVAIDAINFRK